ncbi:MAG TPA: hypothetical protein VGI56_04995 [Galbitalea sp.]
MSRMTRHQLIAAPIVAIALAITLVVPTHELAHNVSAIKPAVSIAPTSSAGSVASATTEVQTAAPWMFTAVEVAAVLLLVLITVIAISVALLIRRRRPPAHIPFD